MLVIGMFVFSGFMMLLTLLSAIKSMFFSYTDDDKAGYLLVATFLLVFNIVVTTFWAQGLIQSKLIAAGLM